MKRRPWLGLTLLLTGSFLLSCLCGRYPLTAGDLCEIVSGQAAGTMKETIFWNIRMARTCVTGLCGAALALAGIVYQGLFRNPLVSPDVLGVSGGASVGAICAILFCGGSAAFLQLFSFAEGIITVALSLLLARAIGGNRYFNLIISCLFTIHAPELACAYADRILILYNRGILLDVERDDPFFEKNLRTALSTLYGSGLQADFRDGALVLGWNTSAE